MPKPKNPDAVISSVQVTDATVVVSTAGTKPAPSSKLRNYELDYGDGSPILTGNGAPPASFPPYTYAASSTYRIKLQVWDKNGYTDSDTREVDVVVPTPEPPHPNLPSAPTGLTASVQSATIASLHWNASANATSYTIERSPHGLNTFTAKATGTGLDFIDANLSPSTTYDYRVKASNAEGDSPYSPLTTVSTPSLPVPAGDVLTLADLHYVGAIRLNQQGSQLQFSFGGLALRKVNGKTRFLIPQDYKQGHAPAEFESPGEYDINGVLISGSAFTSAYATAPVAPLITNWGVNKDGSNYDFYHGIAGKWYDADGKEFNDFPPSGGGAAIWNCFYENGKFHAMYGAMYGAYHEWGHMFCTLDDPAGPISTAYGPFNIQSPGNTPYPTSDGTYTRGLRRASYFLKTHDGGYGHGGAQSGSYQQGQGPDGPTLFLGFTPPGVTTPSGYPNTLVTPYKGLLYYTLNGIMDVNDGSLPVGQPIWSFRQPGFPYPYERSQGGHTAINPALNGGIGTWVETDQLAGMAYLRAGTKHGYIAVVAKCSNHKIGSNQIGCSVGGQTVSHNWYAAGGNQFCDHGCESPVQITGPVTTYRELMFAIYDPKKIDEVKAGTRVDYSVDPESFIYPTDDMDAHIQLPTVGIVGPHASGVAVDEENNMMYLLVIQRDDTTFGFTWPLIYAFQARTPIATVIGPTPTITC